MRSVLCVFLAASLAACAGPRADGDGERGPGLLSRSVSTVGNSMRSVGSVIGSSLRSVGKLSPFRGGGKRSKLPRDVHGLEMEMTLSPDPVKLSETRRIAVSVRITNRSKRLVHLQFPTAQRLEILVRDPAGRVIVQWSEDQYFAQAVSYLAINPGERVEYSEKVPTRELVAGTAYTVEAFLVRHDDLRARKTIVPER